MIDKSGPGKIHEVILVLNEVRILSKDEKKGFCRKF